MEPGDRKLLNSVQKMGTVKDFIYGGMSEGEKQLHVFTVVKLPQFGEYAIGKQNAWKHVDRNERSQKGTKESGSTKPERGITVQQKHCTMESRQRQFMTAKQMIKVLKKNEPVYLALIRPKAIQNERGVTQKIKREQMKQTGPVRKAPPVAETRKKICSAV